MVSTPTFCKALIYILDAVYDDTTTLGDSDF
jgi:hypothetical protein